MAGQVRVDRQSDSAEPVAAADKLLPPVADAVWCFVAVWAVLTQVGREE